MDELLQVLARILQRLEALDGATRNFLKKLDTAQDPRGFASDYGKRVAEDVRALQADVKEADAIARKTRPAAGAVKPETLARHFRTVIERIQQEALDPERGPIGATLRGVEVEVKGLIVVENEEPRIVTPTPDRPVEAGQLSTVRMSFGSVPVLRAQPEAER